MAMAAALAALAAAASPPNIGGYDYSKPTCDNYADPHARIRREFFQARCHLVLQRNTNPAKNHCLSLTLDAGPLASAAGLVSTTTTMDAIRSSGN